VAPREADVEERRLAIAGRRVPLHRARFLLRQALQQLDPLDRQLLLGLHEGFCCAELAERFRRSETCVKTRIHRARRRVRLAMETCVRAAGSLEP
jgi:DNA-directed RNA polymerase specialized sigma24 family protein